jgi:TetR/AcrR family transcriptional repressor of nem operon
MKVTKDQILNMADGLIREVGYNNFSYTDISVPLQIKNSSMHYHFPSKSDLGVEVIKRAIDRFIADSAGWRALTYRQQLAKIVETYTQKQGAHCVCLVGALSPVYDTLPAEMQQELKNIVTLLLDKLVEVLTNGKTSGEFDFPESPKAKACMIQSSLIASLLLDRVLQNDVFETIQQEILSI